MLLRDDALVVDTADDWTVIPAGADPTQLAELSAFRGRILYANGRRPGFVTPSGTYIDDDPLDFDSFHITVRTRGQIVGCIRLRPLPQHSRTLFAPIMGEAELGAFLADLGVARRDCLEARGLTAEPSRRGASLGTKLMLGCWILGRSLGKRLVLGAVGTRDGQSKLMAHIGAQLIPGTAPVFASEFDDALQAMYLDLDHPPATLQSDMDRVAGRLNLSGMTRAHV
jgi:hypothetical protein